MKKKSVILSVIFAILILTIALFAFYQRNNISALITSVFKTEEQISTELNDSKKRLEEELKDKYSTQITDLTAEEEKMLMKGQLSVEQAVENINQKYEENKKDGLNFSEVDNLIGDKVIELYSLKAYYLGQLGQMEAIVKRDYFAMPKEKRNVIGLKELADKYMGKATALLNQCDTQVAGIVAQLEKELIALKADTSIIKTIQNTYEKEKALKKAYYLKMLEE